MKVCFVCTGNTCRSPMLEFMFRQFLAEKGEDISVISAGTMQHAKPMSQYTKNVLNERGVPYEDRLSQFASKELLDGCDRVYTMTKEQADFVKSYAKSVKIAPLSKLCGSDIADPYGLGQAAYDEVYKQFEKILPLLLADIKKPEKKKTSKKTKNKAPK